MDVMPVCGGAVLYNRARNTLDKHSFGAGQVLAMPAPFRVLWDTPGPRMCSVEDGVLALGEQDVVLVELRDGRAVRRRTLLIPERSGAVTALGSSGRFLAACCQHHVCVFDLDSPQAVPFSEQLVPGNCAPACVAVDPVCGTLLLGLHNRVIEMTFSGKVLRTFGPGGTSVALLGFGAVCLVSGGELVVLDRQGVHLQRPGVRATCLAASADGRALQLFDGHSHEVTECQS